MADYSLPPWLQAADPAAYAARGMQMGIELGAKQAAQRFAEQQALREQQMAEEKLARVDAEMGLRAQEVGIKAALAARRAQAQQDYRQAIEAGEDPLKALLRFGPAMGSQGTAEAAAIRSSQQKPVPHWRYEQVPGGGMVAVSDQGGIRPLPMPRQAAPPAQWKPETRTINGIPVMGQVNQSTGLFHPIAQGMQKPGGLTPQQRAELGTIKARLKEMHDDTGELLDPNWQPKKGAKFYTLEKARALQSEYATLKARQQELEQGSQAGSSGITINSIRLKDQGQAPDEPSDEANAPEGETDTNPDDGEF